MSKTFEITCPHCGTVNIFDESDLVSGMSIKDDQGNIVQENPPVEVDSFTFVRCENCGYPMGCGDAVSN